MSEIKRYEAFIARDGRGGRFLSDREDPAGWYVTYDDHAEALTTERTARETAEATVARLREDIERLAEKWTREADACELYGLEADSIGLSAAAEANDRAADHKREAAAELRALLEGGA